MGIIVVCGVGCSDQREIRESGNTVLEMRAKAATTAVHIPIEGPFIWNFLLYYFFCRFFVYFCFLSSESVEVE